MQQGAIRISFTNLNNEQVGHSRLTMNYHSSGTFDINVY